MNLVRKVASMNPGTRITLLDQALVSGCNFLVAILLTRFAGLEIYGSFALAWMGLLLMSSIHQAFVLIPMMSMAPKKKADEKTSYFQQTQLIQLGFTLLILLVISPAVAYADQLLPKWEVSSLFPILPSAIFAYLMQDYYRRYFFIKGKPAYALLVDFLAYPGMLVGILFCYLTGQLAVIEAYFAVTLSFGLAAVVGILCARVSFKLQIQNLSDTLSQHWKFSSWLLGTALLQFFSSNYFLVAAAALLGPAGLGALRIAQNLLGLTHVLFQAMENVVPIKASEEFVRNGFEGMKIYLQGILLKSGLVVCSILLLLALFAKTIIGLAYGEEYSMYSYLLMGYCLFYLSLFPGYPLRYALRTLELTRPMFTAYLLSTGFSLLFAFPMVENWGLFGVVAGLIGTQILMQACYLFSLGKYANKHALG